jgi:hypothetical protein
MKGARRRWPGLPAAENLLGRHDNHPQHDAVTGKLLRTLADRPRGHVADDSDGQRCWQHAAISSNLAGAGRKRGGGELMPQQTIKRPTRHALTENAARYVTGCDDGSVRLCDRASGKEIERFSGHTGPVTTVAVSADGSAIISSGADRTVRRFGLTLTHVALGLERTTALAISPDGRQIITAGPAGEVVSWSLADLTRVRDFPGAAGPIRAAAVSADGELLAAGGDDSHLRIWSSKDGALLADVNAHTPITTIDFVKGGRQAMVAGADGYVRHYELSRSNDKLDLSLVLQGRGHVGAVRRVAVADQDRLAISIAADAKICVWSIADSQPRWTRGGQRSFIRSRFARIERAGGGRRRRPFTDDFRRRQVLRDFPARRRAGLAWRRTARSWRRSAATG